MHNRHFLKTITGFSAGLPVMINLEKLNFSLVSSSSADVVKDETVWAKVRQGYLLKEDYINLENRYSQSVSVPIQSICTNAWGRGASNVECVSYVDRRLNHDAISVLHDVYAE